MTNRRKFIKQVVAASIASSIPIEIASQQQQSSKDLIWANQLSLNYSRSDDTPEKYKDPNFKSTDCKETWQWARQDWPFVRFDDAVWDTLINEMATVGMNMVVLNVGNCIQYESHPEISIEGAWSHDKLKSVLAKCRKLGIEVIPKLNFSACHDLWLGKYSRMLSTDIYYDVCRNIINEVCALFSYPRFFHLGMDEETADHQKNLKYAVIRQGDLWWGDLYFLIGELEKNGVRPWVWSDYGWHHPDLFFRKMPKSVLQSNWYYGGRFNWKKENMVDSTVDWQSRVKYYNDLDKHGYDQIPTGSNYIIDRNFDSTVDYCKSAIDPSRLLGFMTAPWRPTLSPCLEHHKEAITLVGKAIKKFH